MCIVTNEILLFCFSDTSDYVPVDSPFEALQNDTTAEKLIWGRVLSIGTQRFWTSEK